jgi:hypothetical protein
MRSLRKRAERRERGHFRLVAADTSETHTIETEEQRVILRAPACYTAETAISYLLKLITLHMIHFVSLPLPLSLSLSRAFTLITYSGLIRLL